MTVKLREDIEALKNATGNGTGSLGAKITALENLISDDGETKTLFGMVVTIDNSTGAVSLTAPASEG